MSNIDCSGISENDISVNLSRTSLSSSTTDQTHATTSDNSPINNGLNEREHNQEEVNQVNTVQVVDRPNSAIILELSNLNEQANEQSSTQNDGVLNVPLIGSKVKYSIDGNECGEEAQVLQNDLDINVSNERGRGSGISESESSDGSNNLVKVLEETMTDSSDVLSSSSDEESSDESGDDDGDLMDPETMARILFQGQHDGDNTYNDYDEANATSHAPMKTKNEVSLTKVEKPSVQVTPDMKLCLIGTIKSIVQHYEDSRVDIILIKAQSSAVDEVYDCGSCLCLEDGRVIGVIDEAIGRVNDPFYTCLMYSNDRETNCMELGSRVYVVEEFATKLITAEISKIKGSDASNIYDEEPPESEMEFSDDEAERNFKKARKHSVPRNSNKRRTMQYTSCRTHGLGERGGGGGDDRYSSTTSKALGDSPTPSHYPNELSNGEYRHGYGGCKQGEDSQRIILNYDDGDSGE